jgi:DNA polymerase III delta prime subunit
MTNIFDKLFPEDLHHSYVIQGNPKETINDLIEYLEINKYIRKKSPDIFFQIYDAFNIENTNDIKNWHNQYNISSDKKVCILGANLINREAEQSLLKIIEEPKNNTHFFIIIPNINQLADTIISRVHIIKIDKINDDQMEKIVNNFLQASIKNRLEIIAQLVKENKDNENSAKLRIYAIDFLKQVEKIYYNKFQKNKKNINDSQILLEIQKIRSYLYIPGSSAKMLLEHLALYI